MRKVPARLQELVEPVAIALGYELVGIEYMSQGKHSVLRIYIDKDDGITADDCGAVSHQVSGVLDVEDPIKGAYHLEVSSPGLDRPLFALEHFERFMGNRAKVLLHAPLDGRRKFTGELGGIKDTSIILHVDDEEILIPYDSIEKANLVPEF
jgi:ribosome maturation factor RimP